jgi:hypothetical protein
LSVLHQAGRKEGQVSHRRSFWSLFDGSPYELEKIRSGDLDATVSQPLNLYAQLSVEYLRRAVKGETFKEGPTPHGSGLILAQRQLFHCPDDGGLSLKQAELGKRRRWVLAPVGSASVGSPQGGSDSGACMFILTSATVPLLVRESYCSWFWNFKPIEVGHASRTATAG